MLNRRTWFVALVAVLLMGLLAGCSMGGATTPDREVPISVDAALEGQNAGLMGLMSGQVTWTESQLSSFLTELLKQNSGPNMPIDSITVWLMPDNQIHLAITFADGVFLGGNTVEAAGTIGVVDGKVQVNLSEVAANGLVASGGPILDYVNATINSVLASPSFGVAASVTTGDGDITISIGG